MHQRTPDTGQVCALTEDKIRFAETSAGALLLPAGQQSPTSPHRLRAVPRSTPRVPGGRCPGPVRPRGRLPGSRGCGGSGPGRGEPAPSLAATARPINAAGRSAPPSAPLPGRARRGSAGAAAPQRHRGRPRALARPAEEEAPAAGVGPAARPPLRAGTWARGW